MNPLLRFFSHPVVAALSSVAAIIGVPLAFYFYHASIRAPNLTYHFHPVRTTLVKAGGASALKVLFGGNEMHSDVTAVQIALWNAGKEPISAANILTPIHIQTENSAPILEATIRKVSRGVTQFVLDQSQKAKGEINVTWKILEQDDGGVIQLIYAGDANNKVSVSGSVIGQKTLSELKYSGSISTPSEQYAKQIRDYRLAGLFIFGSGLVMAIFGGIGFLWRRKLPAPREHSLWSGALAGILSMLAFGGILYVIMGCILLYRSAPSGPPFGF